MVVGTGRSILVAVTLSLIAVSGCSEQEPASVIRLLDAPELWLTPRQAQVALLKTDLVHPPCPLSCLSLRSGAVVPTEMPLLRDEARSFARIAAADSVLVCA